MITSQTCSWCNKINIVQNGRPTFCTECEHRADVCRLDCDCGQCRRIEPPRDESGNPIAVGDTVQFVEPYQGYKVGTVVELLRGVMGPIAGVKIDVAPSRTVDTLCRRLRKAGG